MKKITNSMLIILAFCLVVANAAAEEGYIVRFKSEKEAKDFIQLSPFAADYELLNSDLNIYKLEPQKSIRSTKSMSALNMLRSDKRVKYAQMDHPVKMRSVTPNDLDFSKQWSLKNTAKPGADIGATEAWALGTSGKNNRGEDIVVAVVDGGVEINHKDLKDNIWVNKNEVAGNGIDDDGNGYIDDVNGWNAYNNNGNITNNSHGTHVAGIVSARGNNGLQVTGVNWNVKIMAIPGSSGTTATVIRAYTYAFKQKELWIQTNGEKGANVVATNSSFGVDFAKCDSGDYPVWNDMYNQLGRVGILSAAATINDEVNVDLQGDVPTACDSNYLVTVTNTQNDDSKYVQSGYGKTAIDLGAPGTNVLSTYIGGGTASLTGTSMSTPHVAGAIAFLHSVASPQLSSVLEKNPSQGALIIKKILLESVDVLPGLKDKTVTGGRLNLATAAKKAYNYIP